MKSQEPRKKTATLILVQASDFEDALKNFLEGMKGTMGDFGDSVYCGDSSDGCFSGKSWMIIG